MVDVRSHQRKIRTIAVVCGRAVVSTVRGSGLLKNGHVVAEAKSRLVLIAGLSGR
jgi:hypothetical protein